MHMNLKISSSRLYGFCRMRRSPKKLVVREAPQNKWSPVFSEKLAMLQLLILCNVKQSILNCTQSFVCRKSSREIRKINRQRRITLHHENAYSHLSVETNEFLSIQNGDLMILPPFSPDLTPYDIFYSQILRINYIGSVFEHQKKLLISCI